MLSFLFPDKIKTALRKGAAIIDVRTVHEYDQGRIKGSVNIPTDRIPASLERIKNFNKVVIIVGNAGSSNGAVVRILKQNGIKEAYNGGNWENVLKKINKL